MPWQHLLIMLYGDRVLLVFVCLIAKVLLVDSLLLRGLLHRGLGSIGGLRGSGGLNPGGLLGDVIQIVAVFLKLIIRTAIC